jgi:hypothetical protein
MQKYNEIPSPLTFEWLSQNARRELLASREMEFALAESMFEEKYFDMKLNKIFAEDYPNSLKNALKLALWRCLNSKTKEKMPHIQALLDLIKEMPAFSVFYEDYRSIEEEFNSKIMKIEESWQKIKGVRFEKALVAMEVLYLKIFLPNFDKLYEDDDKTLDLQDYFLEGASDYLNKAKGHWKPIDKNLWKDRSKLSRRMNESFTDLLNDEELLKKIENHVYAIMDKNIFLQNACDRFFYDSQDGILCYIKDKILRCYHYMLGLNFIDPDSLKEEDSAYMDANFLHGPMLRDYFGIDEQFSHDGKTYDLMEVLTDKGMVDDDLIHSELKDLYDFYQENSDDMSFREMLIKTALPMDICKFSEFIEDCPSDGEGFRLLGTDVGDSQSQINLNLHNTFYCGQSDICLTFFHAKANSATGYLAMLNLMKKEGKRSDGENIGRLFKELSCFDNAKITTDHSSKGMEIGIAICKDKTLILIEPVSVYKVASLAENIIFEKRLIAAGHNLNKIIAALQTEPELLAEITGSSDVKFEELRIETMIIGDSFEFDGKKFQGHKKISFLELIVALNDDASDLVMFSPKAVSHFEEAKKFDIDLSDLVLYSTDKPSMEDFFNALNSDIWKKVLDYWK